MSGTASEMARLRAALVASEARAEAAESELAQARAVVSTSEAMIEHLKLEIAKLRRDHSGHSAERRARLIDQPEMRLEDLEAAATEDEIAAGKAKTTAVAGFERRRPARKPFPEHLPRQRVVIDAPSACSCCGSDRIVKMGEDITETLAVIPRQWKVQTVRETFRCRAREKISQPPAPFHPTPRGWAGPTLPAFAIGLEHMATQWLTPVRDVRSASAAQPAGRARCKGGYRPQPLDAGRPGRGLRCRASADPRPDPDPCSGGRAPARPLSAACFACACRAMDDTTVPLLAKGGTQTARLWTHVRDDQPFGGGAPQAAFAQRPRTNGGNGRTPLLARQGDGASEPASCGVAGRSPGPLSWFASKPLPGNGCLWRRQRPLSR